MTDSTPLTPDRLDYLESWAGAPWSDTFHITPEELRALVAAARRVGSVEESNDRLSAQVERLLPVLYARDTAVKERDAARLNLKGACTVCWTSAWEPCRETDEAAEPVVDAPGTFVRCAMCLYSTRHAAAVKAWEVLRRECDALETLATGEAARAQHATAARDEAVRELASDRSKTGTCATCQRTVRLWNFAWMDPANGFECFGCRKVFCRDCAAPHFGTVAGDAVAPPA